MKDILTIVVEKTKISYVVTNSGNFQHLLSRRPTRKFAEIYECSGGGNGAAHAERWCPSSRLLRGLHDCSHLGKS